MKKFAAVAVAATTFIGSIALTAPAQAAPPTVTITLSSTALATGDAMGTGAQVLLGQPVAVNVGGTVTAQVNANYGASAARQYKADWYSCPTRGAALADCTQVSAGTTTNGSASTSFTYSPIASTAGRFIRFRILVSNQAGESGVYESAGASDVNVYPGLATGGRPTVAANPRPAAQTNISLQAWSLKDGAAFASRAVTVWSCPSASNGQTSGAGWNVAGEGCTDVSSGIASTFNTLNATTIAFNVPANAEGRYLVVADNVLYRAGNLTAIATVRSAGAQALTATPSPTPSPTATATPTAAPTAAPAAKFRIAVITKSSVTRGARLKVVVSTSTATSIGTAKVQIKKRPTAKGGAAQTLKSIDVVNGTGQSVTRVGKRLAKGNYYVFATYVDDRSGKVTTASAPITIR